MILRPISTATSLVVLSVALGLTLGIQPAIADSAAPAIKVNPDREAYYGDLHLHTTYSFDAYVLFGAKVDPDKAYKFARGEAVEYLGQMVQRREPLDFLAVTDHSENIGVFNRALPPDSPYANLPFIKGVKAELAPIMNADGTADAQKALPALNKYFIGGQEPMPEALKEESRSAWGREIAFANKNNEPGKFTAFIAYEWTSMIDGANLHRNVIFKGDSAPLPFTSLDSKKPEDLWNYLQTVRKQGFEALAIPHNGNASNGLMYDWTTVEGKPIDKVYAQMRQENEPLSEIGQNKGNSETHPILSPNDEFANFEIFDQLLISPTYSKPQGSYVRDALSRGLVMQRTLGVNPYKDGIVGASDLHGGLSVGAQADYGGYIGGANIGGGKVAKEQASATLGVTGDDGHSAGFKMLKTTSGYLTGAWAESNTRDSIYSAFRRRETFATSGTRIKLRFFGGWAFDKGLLAQPAWVRTAYSNGVPMGGDLPAKAAGAKAPSFAVWALKDPNSGNLDRVQIVKVWEDGGKQEQKVFDVAWSDDRKLDPVTGKLPDVGNTVDLKTGHYANSIGATELKAVWADPEFKPDHLAAYYLRVLEIPTPRWSTLLALQTGLPIPADAPATIQERGYSSPIWYTPTRL